MTHELSRLCWLLKEEGWGSVSKLEAFTCWRAFLCHLCYFFLIKCVIWVCEKLPVASPFRSFNSVMQMAPGPESRITLHAWPEPSSTAWPAGCRLPQGTLTSQPSRKQPQHRAPRGPTGQAGVQALVASPSQGMGSCSGNGGESSKNQTNKNIPLKN